MKVLKVVLAALGGLVLLGFIYIYYDNTIPKLTLGLVEGGFREIPNKDNSVSSQTSYQDKYIEPLEMKDSMEETLSALKEALNAYGGIEIRDEEEDYLYAVATTGLMKFQDDLEIYVDADTGLVHYRSASRAGYGDMGLNRSRYEAVAEFYNKQ